MPMPNPWFRAETFSPPLCQIYNGQPYRAPREGERRHGPFILPPFQRPPVWTTAQQIRLIESLWHGLPIGAYIYNQAPGSRTDEWLLDGQQRAGAVLAYVADRFPVFGVRFSELSVVERRSFDMRPVAALRTRIESPGECYEVYKRLAYGGTPHEPQ